LRALTWVRDVTFDEDRSQVRTAALPQTLAALRCAMIGLLRCAGACSTPPSTGGGRTVWPRVRGQRGRASHIVHVHLKDVVSSGAHETCRFGQGCVRIEQCVRALQAIGYGGAISVEHEPARFDPTQDCIANVQLLASWLESAAS